MFKINNKIFQCIFVTYQEKLNDQIDEDQMME